MSENQLKYIQYLQRSTRTTDVTLMEEHMKALSKQVMELYDVHEDEQLLFEIRRLDDGIAG